jgi:hypothetical protein
VAQVGAIALYSILFGAPWFVRAELVLGRDKGGGGNRVYSARLVARCERDACMPYGAG